MLPHFFDPIRFASESVYTTIIVFFCFLIYFKTKKFYNLSKYQGIQYFRNAFLFFGLAYLARFVIHLLQLIGMASNLMGPRRFMFPAFMIPVGYLSTIAIFYLTYSTIWKKIGYNHFLILSNLVAIIVSVIAFITRSPFILSILQLLLLLATFIIGFMKHKKGKKTSNIRALYLLIAIFWLINIFVLDTTRRFFLFEFKVIFQVMSIGVFFAIYYKVMKWVK